MSMRLVMSCCVLLTTHTFIGIAVPGPVCVGVLSGTRTGWAMRLAVRSTLARVPPVTGSIWPTPRSGALPSDSVDWRSRAR